MKISSLSFLLCMLPLLATGAHVELSSKYPFQKVLFDDQGQFYGLYWNYSVAAGTIHFAVNVSTTGWVGFGVSPNGQMPGSDVVIGWVVADGMTYFHDRYAERRVLPRRDASQDWFLSLGEEEDGYTILEFSRNLTTCDTRDLNIEVGTARIIWSISNNDPSYPLGDSETHNYQGSASINLLGGLASPPSEPADQQSFDIGVSNVTLPSDSTTYWCQSFELPEDIRNATKYVTRISPVIAPHVREYVHHMLVYLCTLPLSSVGQAGSCFSFNEVTYDLLSCTLNGLLIAAWAVGGEDFIFPEKVALPLGGVGTHHHVVIQMHYDNPKMEEGVTDSSGMRLYYSSTPRKYDAGVISLGHNINRLSEIIIPPGAANYTIGSICVADCTKNYLPEGGIHIFANFLHTHLVGRALELQHLRWNSECEVYEELAPIDLNPNYDFDFQQTTYLPNEVTVLPGDILVLKCYYNTTNRTSVTVGGESTNEEMCLAFPMYYPRSPDRNLDVCFSDPSNSAFTNFTEKYYPLNPETNEQNGFIDNLNVINWTSEVVQDLERTVLTGQISVKCGSESETFTILDDVDSLPQVGCPYQAPDQCNCFEPQSCCERVAAGDKAIKPTGCPATTGGVITETSRGVVVVPHGVYVIITALLMLWSTMLPN